MTTTETFTHGTAPGALPIVGHGLRLRGHMYEFLESLAQYGDLVEIRLGMRPAYVVCHPALVHQVLLDDRTFDKGGPQAEKLREFIGWGLATATHDSHRRQRRLAQPAFHKPRMAEYARLIGEEIDAVSGSWRDGAITDVQRDMYRLSVRTTVRTLFGADLSVEQVDELRRAIEIAFEGVYKRVLSPLGLKEKLPLPSNRRYDKALEMLASTLDEVIRQNREAVTSSGDMLTSLIAARHEGDRLSAQELRDTALSVLIGGSDTTSAMLTWTLHLLGQHPNAADQARAEADRVLMGRTAAWDDMPKLEYTHRVLKEAMRLYPPVPLLTRAATRDADLGGRRIPQGATVVYSPYLLHRRPELFDDPTRFDPDRWGESRPCPTKGAFVPFGLGARQCIGNDFASMRGALALSTFLTRWRFEPVLGKDEVRPAPGGTVLHPQRLVMRLHAR